MCYDEFTVIPHDSQKNLKKSIIVIKIIQRISLLLIHGYMNAAKRVKKNRDRVKRLLAVVY